MKFRSKTDRSLVPENGIDVCYCGCKYWRPDGTCIDCGESVNNAVDLFGAKVES